MNNKDNKWSVNFGWVQPYSYSQFTAADIFRQLSITEELARLNTVDKIVETMDTYPDAEKIIQNIKKSS